MLHKMQWLKRTLTVGAGAALLIGATALPAQAASTSTTGAKGEWVFASEGSGPGGYPFEYNLYVTDTLTDGHCARWQRRINAGSWQWYGTQSCGGRVYAGKGYGRAGYVYRVCRTGVVNCSPPQEFA